MFVSLAPGRNDSWFPEDTTASNPDSAVNMTTREPTEWFESWATPMQFPGTPGLLPFAPTLGVLPNRLVENRGSVATDTTTFAALDYALDYTWSRHLGARERDFLGTLLEQRLAPRTLGVETRVDF